MNKSVVYGNPAHSGNIRSLLILFFLYAVLTSTVLSQVTPSHQVLLINSYNPGMVFSDEELRGVKESLAPFGDDLELRIEYMDTKEISDPEHIENLRDLYAHKYQNAGIDVIIATDNSAFDFMKKYRDELFPGIPVVFSGLNYFSEDMLENAPDFTGVVEDKDIRSTLDLAFRQFPDISHIYVIHDTTDTGLASGMYIRQFVPEYEDQADFTFISNVTTSELIDTVSHLPKDSIILLEGFNRDADGIVYTHEEIGDLISANTDLPMYGNTEMYVGHGIIGGKITTGYQQGELAGELAMHILKGEPVSSHPVIENSPNVFMFDYEKLLRFGIPQSSLPDGSIVINQPSIDQVPAWALFLAVVIILSLGVVIIILVLNMRVRRRIEADLRANISSRERAQADLKAANSELHAAYEHMSTSEEELRQSYETLVRTENELRESERKFRAVFNQTFELIGILDLDGGVLEMNETGCAFSGFGEGEIIGRPFWEASWGRQGTDVHQKIRDAVFKAAKGEFCRFEIGYDSPGIGFRYLDFSIKPVFDDYGSVIMLIPEGRDITDRRMAKEALGQALKKLNVLNNVTFSDIRKHLYALFGYAGLMRDESDPDVLKNIAESKMLIARKINSLLDFAKTYQDLGLKEPVWQEAVQTYLYASSHLDVLAFSRTIDLEGLEIYADPMLEKVFYNLIDNTIKHGEGATFIQLSYYQEPSGLKLVYEDNGPGIPEDMKEEIFKRGSGEQKGMGLFLAREILGITGISLTETGVYMSGVRFEMSIPNGRYRLVSGEKG